MLQETLLDYVAIYQRSPDIAPSLFLDAVAGPLGADVLAAYDAPFPDRSYKAGLRQFTALIPLTRNDPGAAIGRDTMAALQQWKRPFLTAYSDGDPATRGLGQGVPGACSRRPEARPHDDCRRRTLHRGAARRGTGRCCRPIRQQHIVIGLWRGADVSEPPDVDPSEVVPLVGGRHRHVSPAVVESFTVVLSVTGACVVGSVVAEGSSGSVAVEWFLRCRGGWLRGPSRRRSPALLGGGLVGRRGWSGGGAAAVVGAVLVGFRDGKRSGEKVPG